MYFLKLGRMSDTLRLEFPLFLKINPKVIGFRQFRRTETFVVIEMAIVPPF